MSDNPIARSAELVALLREVAAVHPWQSVDGITTCAFCERAWDHAVDCLWLRIRAALTDVSSCPRCGGRGQVYYPGDHIVDCELCTAHIDGDVR